MRLLEYLKEEYECRVTANYGKTRSYEVFTNPSLKEIRSMIHSEDLGVKFIAEFKTKKVYVWAAIGPLHEPAWEQIKGRDLYNDVYGGKILPGYAKIKGSKLVMTTGDGTGFFNNYIDDNGNKEVEKRWGWLNKHIDIKDFFNNVSTF